MRLGMARSIAAPMGAEFLPQLGRRAEERVTFARLLRLPFEGHRKGCT